MILKNKLLLLLIVFVIPVYSMANSSPQTIAVLDFKNNSLFGGDDLKPLQQGLANMMITNLSQVRALKIIERSQLNAILEEMALGQSGMVDETTAQNVGKLLGAQYLVLGSFMKGMKNDIRIDCRIVKTETGETIKAEEVSGKLKNILKLMNKLGQKVIKNLDIKLNSREKKALQRLKSGCAYEVVMEYFRALSLIDRHQYRKANILLNKVIERCPDFQHAKLMKRKIKQKLKRD